MHVKDTFVGIQLYGFCNGYFGRDSYDDKKIIASGDDWIVTKNENNLSEFASFDNPEEMEQLITNWSIVEDI